MLAPPRRTTTVVSPLQLAPKLVPIGLAKSMHTQSHQFPGPLQIISGIVRESGPKGLWVGQVGTALRETGGTAMWFVLKEAFASALLKMRPAQTSRNRDLTPWESALSGAVAGGICAAAFYPIDTVKSAMQTADEMQPPKAMGRSSPARLGFTATTKAMWRARGMTGLYVCPDLISSSHRALELISYTLFFRLVVA
jgi:mitochondrial ornithine carrier protein